MDESFGGVRDDLPEKYTTKSDAQATTDGQVYLDGINYGHARADHGNQPR